MYFFQFLYLHILMYYNVLQYIFICIFFLYIISKVNIRLKNCYLNFPFTLFFSEKNQLKSLPMAGLAYKVEIKIN